MEKEALEYKLDVIFEKLSSLEERVRRIEEALSRLEAWRAGQDQKWEARNKMNGSFSTTLSSLEVKIDKLADEIVELKTINRQRDADQVASFRRSNLLLAVFAGLMMMGTLIVQIVMAVR